MIQNITNRDICQYNKLSKFITHCDKVSSMDSNNLLECGKDEMASVGDRIKKRRKELKLSQFELAELCGWETQSRISHYENNHREMKKGDLETIAKALKTTPSYLQFGSTSVENNLEWPSPNTSAISKANVFSHVRKIPIINWEEAKNIMRAINNVSTSAKYILIPEVCSEKSVALEIKGDAMVSPSSNIKSYYEGEIIVVDPLVTAKHNDLVTASLENAPEAIFRQFIIEGGISYLKPLNPQYPMIEIKDNMAITGVVVAYLGFLKQN
jgi:SOS-response transcriptional repressor LexA